MKIVGIIVLISMMYAMPIVAEVQEQIVFRDDFIDNRNDWNESDNEKVLLKIENDKYIFEHKRERGCWLNWISRIKVDQTQDFSIEACIEKRKGRGILGVVWGVKNIRNYHELLLLTKGRWRYIKRIDGAGYDVIVARESKYSTNSTKTISIKKSGSQIEFFVDGKRFGRTAKFEPFFGNGIGFVLCGNIKVEIDDIIIRYFPTEASHSRYTLRISSNPSGAKVYLDGTYEGMTPLQITGLSKQSYRIRIVKDDYEPIEDKVALITDTARIYDLAPKVKGQ